MHNSWIQAVQARFLNVDRGQLLTGAAPSLRLSEH